eukprot:CAMPEP_0172527346 /NCGR_PEP_ID=MMETSP1067-20121228/2057_1 /TAXON_ID=265564 ORGANISM="Thalassiosira punctigera, Strain Tpunct2005C2" /NCGR_SAMPLE_ID=MMETSP1067 /ASSEMBLY_ACC=CAM_ASM_000444 /LENGTH=636 /DNA_ID=CAMNT_0013311073 /DNA_START=69 /DNA_END=1979 /DNA_ORIENTATION=-
MTEAINLLRQACLANLSTASSLSDDGKTLTLLGSSFDATVPQKLTLSDSKGGGTKEVSYTLASIYLLLTNTSLLQYRNACEAARVGDPVKILDKGLISDFFSDAASGSSGAGEDGGLAATDAAASAEDGKKVDEDAMDMSDDEDAAGAAEDSKKESVQFSQPASDEKRTRGRDKDHHRGRGESRSGRDKDRSSSRHRHRDKDHHRSHSKSRKDDDEKEDRVKKGSSGKGAKGAVVPITNEQLVANLSTIVDKRDNVGTPSKEKTPAKEKKDDKEDRGGDGVAMATKDDASTPADTQQTTPAATPALTDDEGGPSKEDAEKKEKDDSELILSWLSPAGFQVDAPAVAAAIEADRDAVRRITALEIPVGDSASILRAGAGGEIEEKRGAEASSTPGGAGGVKKRDFARVLEIYQEVVVAEEKAKRSGSSSGKKRPPPPPSSKHRGKSARTSGGSSSVGGKSPGKPSSKGNPIIVVPNAMTSAITMINAGLFLGKDAVFVPRAQAMGNPAAGKRGGTITLTKRLNQRLGGAEVTYDVIDNPTTKLRKDEWDRVVAVICQGASWQFKGWRYSDPVDLFSRTFGFYVGLEGAAVPNELRGWNVKTGKVSRDRRGLDSVCLASFWNGLEEFMAVHKQELFKS